MGQSGIGDSAQPQPHSGHGQPLETVHVQPFSGTPAKYRKIAIAISVGSHLYLYLGMLYFHGVLGGGTWMFGWKPAVFALVSCPVFARFAFRWIMRLDAQYGTGSGWTLPQRTVKLPEPRRRS